MAARGRAACLRHPERAGWRLRSRRLRPGSVRGVVAVDMKRLRISFDTGRRGSMRGGPDSNIAAIRRSKGVGHALQLNLTTGRRPFEGH